MKCNIVVSIRSGVFDCSSVLDKFTFDVDSFSSTSSSLHSQSFIHLFIYQSILPLGPLMMIDPPSLSPSIPLGPSAAMLPHCSAMPKVSRLPEDVDWMVVPQGAGTGMFSSHTHTCKHTHTFALLFRQQWSQRGCPGASLQHAGYLRSQ